MYHSYVYDAETELYYLQSRYYSPETGRFLNADIYAATGQGLIGNNMFAYCGNNPANRIDPAGTSWFLLFVTVALLATVSDICQFARGDDERVDTVFTEYDEVRIRNSSNVVTPWVQLGYAVYLNNFSEYSDYFTGSSFGITYEWSIHNLGYYGFRAIAIVDEIVGNDPTTNRDRASSCAEVDLAPTVFHDNNEKHKALRTVMKVGYFFAHPYPAIEDGIAYVLME